MISSFLPGTLTARILVVVAIGLLCAFAVWSVLKAIDGIYDRGYQAGKAEVEAQTLRALVDAERRVNDLNTRLSQLDNQYDALQAAALLDTQAAPQTIREIIHANPQFTAVRPAALADQRLRELAAVAAAVRGTGDLPVDRDPALRRAGDRPGPGDGDGD